jgi:hypothetical protein
MGLAGSGPLRVPMEKEGTAECAENADALGKADGGFAAGTVEGKISRKGAKALGKNAAGAAGEKNFAQRSQRGMEVQDVETIAASGRIILKALPCEKPFDILPQRFL